MKTHPLSVMQRAAVMTGRATFSDPVTGEQLRESALADWYYRDNRAQRWVDWIGERVAAGELQVTVQ